MSKLIKTLRRAVLTAIIAGSLVPTAFAGGRSDSFRQKATQAKSSISNHIQNARQSLPSASQIKNALPSKTTIQNKVQSFKNDVKKNIPFSTHGNNPKSGVTNGAGYDRLKSEKEMFKNRGKTDKVVPFAGGNTGITGRGALNTSLGKNTPVKLNNSAIPPTRKVDTSKLQTAFSPGDILALPADIAGSGAKAASKVLPGDAGKALDTASKVLDTNAKVNKTIGDGIGNEVDKALNPPKAPKQEKKGFTSQGQGNATKTTTPVKPVVVKPIKSSGKAKPEKKDPAFFNPDGSFKSSLPVIPGSGSGKGFVQMFPMQADGTFGSKDSTTKAPVANTLPTRSERTRGTNQGGGNGFRGNGGNVLGNVLSNIPQGGFGGGSFGGGAPVQTQDYVEAAPAPQMIEAAPAQQYAPVQQVSAAQAIDTEDAVADLVLVDVKMVGEATKFAGPAYSITLTNQGLAATTKFITGAIISNDGTISKDAPKTMIEVPAMAAGATKEIVIRLPRGESKFMVIALDLNGAVSESDKDNNFAVIERAE